MSFAASSAFWYASGRIYHLITTDKKTSLIKSIEVKTGDQKDIFQSNETIMYTFPCRHDGNYSTLVWLNNDKNVNLLIIDTKTGFCRFPVLEPGSLNELQDLAIKSGKILAFVRNGFSFLLDAGTGNLIEKIRTKTSSGTHRFDKIVHFDPYLSTFSLCMSSTRANLVTYQGRDLRNFKLSLPRSVAFGEKSLTRTAENNQSVVHGQVSLNSSSNIEKKHS